MTDSFSYREYVTDQAFLRDYNAYQAKYAQQIRESDKVLIGLVRDILERRDADRPALRLLDIGCSTGNLLLHLKRLLPTLDLTGGDLAESSLTECRANPELAGIAFRTLDVLDLPRDDRYDVITVNAVLYMMVDEEFERALQRIAGALEVGGTLIVFDFFHPFEQDLTINEVSKTHPNGLRLRFRPISRARQALQAAGFEDPVFRPFTLPVDLPRNPDDSELITYTVATADGARMPFRGTLFQPWCHLTARRMRI
jgi:SAM-dependent methyltransferase